MFTILKFAVYFTISFAILCIPLQNKVLFVYLYETIGPKSEKIVNNITDNTAHSIKTGFKITKKFFDNSKPQSFDEIKGSVSSGVVKMGEKLEEVKDEITYEEEKFLKKVLKESE